jgi:hypothetical protein
MKGERRIVISGEGGREGGREGRRRTERSANAGKLVIALLSQLTGGRQNDDRRGSATLVLPPGRLEISCHHLTDRQTKRKRLARARAGATWREGGREGEEGE